MVKVKSPGRYVARPEWYDRNPGDRVGEYLGIDVAPATDVERLSYTVPTGKKAMVEFIQATIIRSAAATTVGRVYAHWSVTPSGGSVKVIMRTFIIGNAVGEKSDLVGGATITLLAGDALRGHTQDWSTGGTCHFNLTYKITEFDA